MPASPGPSPSLSPIFAQSAPSQLPLSSRRPCSARWPCCKLRHRDTSLSQSTCLSSTWPEWAPDSWQTQELPYNPKQEAVPATKPQTPRCEKHIQSSLYNKISIESYNTESDKRYKNWNVEIDL